MDKAERKSMIKVRGGFSEDMGFNPCNTQPQTSEFDNRTRTFISNKLYDFLQITFEHETEMRNLHYGSSDQNLSTVFCKDLIQNVFYIKVAIKPKAKIPNIRKPKKALTHKATIENTSRRLGFFTNETERTKPDNIEITFNTINPV